MFIGMTLFHWFCSISYFKSIFIYFLIFFFAGPLSSAFVNKYGCRPVTIAGAILASACFIISIFATSIITLYITIGLGVGNNNCNFLLH